MEREEANQTLSKLVDYVVEWFPGVDEISVYGSYMWTKYPNDLDVIMRGSHLPSREIVMMMFPKVHINNINPDQFENRWILWDKRDGRRKFEELDPCYVVKVLTTEVRHLRRDLANARDHHSSSGYFAYPRGS